MAALLAGPALAGPISKQGFNFNVPPCPGHASAVSSTNVFTDGTRLPSCGGRETSGNTITTYTIVWTGSAWAKYPPSVQVTVIQPTAPPGGFAISRSAFTYNQAQALPQGSLRNLVVYLYQGNWYSLVASGGGNFTSTLVASGGGNLVASGGGNWIVSTNGGNILLNGGANLTPAADLARYKAAMGLR